MKRACGSFLHWLKLCYKFLRGRAKLNVQNKGVSLSWLFPALHSITISHPYQGTPWIRGLHSSYGSPNVSHYTNELFFLLCNTSVNICVLVSASSLLWAREYLQWLARLSVMKQIIIDVCLFVMEVATASDLLKKNIVMLRNKHEK